ncbi:endonuclease [Nitriliruptoraceae bacterium ZYF776]|nr:endonuclease [Profundirhabdus halotolerans]
MRVVSLNAWGGALWAELADFVARVDADVLCLQEVPRTAGAAGWTRFEDAERALPQRADLFADVAALLPDARGRYLAGDAGPVRLDDGSTRIQDLGLATFVGPRVVELGAAERFVHGHHVVHEVWPTGDRPRAAQAVRVADREGGPPITVVHLHGVRDPAGKHDTPVRRAQAQALATFVTDVRGPDDLVVVAGDLNLLPDSETFEVLGAVGL